MSLLDFVLQTTKKYIEQMPKSQRKKYGQFFTSKETAVFMAELFEVPVNKEQLHILDAGSALVILSVVLLKNYKRHRNYGIYTWYVMKTILKSLSC